MSHPIDGYLYIEFKQYGHTKPVFIKIPIEHGTFEAFAPLPKNREIDAEIAGRGMDPFGILGSHTRAVKQITDRARLAEYLSGVIATQLAEVITSQDTINGYNQE